MAVATKPFSKDEVADKIYKSKQAGYSDKEIFDYLNQQPQFKDKIKQSLSAGYKPDQIVDFLGSESGQKTAARYAGVASKGLANATPYGIATNLMSALGQAEALQALEEDFSPERLKDLQQKFPGANIPSEINRESYLKAVQQAANTFPTPSNIANFVEEKTGLPFSARTPGQKKTEFVSELAGFKPGTITQKVGAGLKGQAVESILEQAGVPEMAAQATALPYALFERSPPGFKLPPEQKIPQIKDTIFGEPDGGIPPGKSKPPPPSNQILKQEPTDFYEKIQEAQNKIREPLGNRAQNIAEQVSKDHFKSSGQATNELRSEIDKIKTPLQDAFNKEYSLMRQRTKSIQVIPTKLFDDVTTFLSEVPEGEFAKLAPGSQKLISTFKDLQRTAAEVAPNGNLIGYRSVPLSDLIAIKQAVGKIAPWDIVEGSFKKAYEHLYGLLEDEISRGLQSKMPSLYQKYKDLNSRYSEFKKTFENERLLDLMNKRDANFAKIFDSLQNIDSFKAAEKILNQTQRGRQLLGKLRRSIFEKEAGKNLSPAEVGDLKQILGKNKQGLLDRAQAFKKELPSVFTDSPEKLLKAMDSRSGIKKVREELKNVPGGDHTWEVLKEAKVDEILSNGKINKNSTVKEMYDVLNNQKNFNLLSELEGRENVATELRRFGSALEKEEGEKIANAFLKEVGISLLKGLPGGSLVYKFGKHFFKG